MSNEIKKSKAIKIISLSNICVLLIVAVADIINNTMWQQLYNTSSFTQLQVCLREFPTSLSSLHTHVVWQKFLFDLSVGLFV